MFKVIFATGEQIYTAAVAGAKRGYNRSTDEYSKYAEVLDEHYKAMLGDVSNRAERRRIKKHTGKDWRKAYLPLSMALVHRHIGGQECEEHARVFLTSNPARVFDIPMNHWNEMNKQSERLFA
jgi:hypothetical protein